jgi:Caspase domain
MQRRAFIAGLLATSSASAFAQAAPASPVPLIYYAGQAGRLTSDRDGQDGNPFASALVQVIAEKPLTLETFTRRMAEANAIHSRGWQQLDYPRRLPEPKLRLDAKGGKRIALVLINSDYSQSDAYSLPGAVVDAKRVPEALSGAGFETTIVFNRTVVEARAALDEFGARSEEADVAAIYIGGHGAQHGRSVYWLMGDYPAQDAKWLPTHAIAVDEIAKAGRARALNMVLYASCRDDPFSETQ